MRCDELNLKNFQPEKKRVMRSIYLLIRTNSTIDVILV